MLKSFKSFKSFKGNSNLLFQILCKITAILLYRCEENIKKLLNRFFQAFTPHSYLHDIQPTLYIYPIGSKKESTFSDLWAIILVLCKRPL